MSQICQIGTRFQIDIEAARPGPGSGPAGGEGARRTAFLIHGGRGEDQRRSGFSLRSCAALHGSAALSSRNSLFRQTSTGPGETRSHTICAVINVVTHHKAYFGRVYINMVIHVVLAIFDIPLPAFFALSLSENCCFPERSWRQGRQVRSPRRPAQRPGRFVFAAPYLVARGSCRSRRLRPARSRS